MRRLIRTSWVVGYADGQHRVLRDGACVVEDQRVLHVGKAFDGPVDAPIDAPGKPVTPGLITTHLHAGLNAGEHFFLDVGRPEAMARNYLNWQARVRGRPRHKEDTRTAVLFGPGQCPRQGATTVVEVGAAGDPPRFVEAVRELGIRASSGPSYRNAALVSRLADRLALEAFEERFRPNTPDCRLTTDD